MSATTTTAINVPGPQGIAGTTPAAGTNGVSAFTTVSTAFTMPAEGADVTVTVADSTWMVSLQFVYVQNAGHMRVQSKPDSTSVVLRNMESTGTSSYTDNVAPGTSIPVASQVSPAGLQGPAGNLTGTATGTDLTGTFPGATLKVTSAKGDIIVNQQGTASEPRNSALSVGSDGKVLHCRASETLGVIHDSIDLSGTNTSLSGVLGATRGGSGQNTLALSVQAFLNAIASVANGDLLLRGASNWARLAKASTNGNVLGVFSGAVSYGSLNSLISSRSAAATLTAPEVPEAIYLCTAGASGFTLTLSPAADYFDSTKSVKLTFVKVDSAAGNITIDPDGSETINSNSTKSLTTQWDKVSIVTDGSNWFEV